MMHHLSETHPNVSAGNPKWLFADEIKFSVQRRFILNVTELCINSRNVSLAPYRTCTNYKDLQISSPGYWIHTVCRIGITYYGPFFIPYHFYRLPSTWTILTVHVRAAKQVWCVISHIKWSFTFTCSTWQWCIFAILGGCKYSSVSAVQQFQSVWDNRCISAHECFCCLIYSQEGHQCLVVPSCLACPVDPIKDREEITL